MKYYTYSVSHKNYSNNNVKKIIIIISSIVIAICYIMINKTTVRKTSFITNDCFLVVKGDKILKQTGDCKLRHLPCSTFKIAICLMGFNEGILIDENTPEWTFKGGYFTKNDPSFVPMWAQPNTPSTWMKHSCSWYSQAITQKIGIEKFKEYLIKFNYGNLDIYNDPKKGNALTNCWISGPLKISAEEQVAFLRKLVENQLPVSKKAHEITKKLMYEGELGDGWSIYGRKGTGCLLNADETPLKKKGWYIGWLQNKVDQIIIFAYYTESDEKGEISTGENAKKVAIKRLLQLIADKIIS